MMAAYKIERFDYTSAELRKLSAKVKSVYAARRMLAIAAMLEGVHRREAARCNGMDDQTLRDWVIRYNQSGIEGLYDRMRGHKRSYLTPEQKEKLKQHVLIPPDPVKDKIVRWRCCDIKSWLEQEFGVTYHEDYIGRLLRKLGLSYITSRPVHPKGDPIAQEVFKKL